MYNMQGHWLYMRCCKGICAKGITGNPKIKRYNTGQKFCSSCNKFIRYEGHRCPCCNELFRVKSRGNKDKDVWLKAY
mgnify:FL=1